MCHKEQFFKRSIFSDRGTGQQLNQHKALTITTKGRRGKHEAVLEETMANVGHAVSEKTNTQLAPAWEGTPLGRQGLG